MMGRILLLLLLVAVVPLLLPPAAHALTVEEVSKQLMDPCENCKGKLLSSCDCGPAAALKVDIQGMIDEGLDESGVIARVVAEHGAWMRAAPEKKGFNLLGWIFPFVLIAAGAGGIFLYLRRAVARSAPRPLAVAVGGAPQSIAAPEREDAYYRAVLERELRALEK